MTSRVEGGSTYTQAFDTENRLTSVTVSGQVTTFAYDPDGNLVKKINPDNSKTLYVGGIYEVDKNSGGSVTGTKTYYPAAGAMRVGSTLYYVLKDHLGSASVVTDASGNTVGEDRFYPFGETRFTTGTMYTDKLFTGQRQMTELGIYHYGARFYSPKLGRFLSADTIVPGYANPQNLNRYSYVTNNPVRYIDPTGHRQCEDYGGTCLSENQVTQIWEDTHGDPDEPADNDDDDDNPGSDYCATHRGACGDLLTTPTPTLTEPTLTPAPGGANDYYCSSHPWACGNTPTTPSSPTESSSEQTCLHCGGLFLGTLALLEGLNLAVVGTVAAGAVIMGAPLWAAVIPAAIFVGVALVGVNWMVVGIQEINAGLHPDEHIEVDYLPLVPDAWQR